MIQLSMDEVLPLAPCLDLAHEILVAVTMKFIGRPEQLGLRAPLQARPALPTRVREAARCQHIGDHVSVD